MALVGTVRLRSGMATMALLLLLIVPRLCLVWNAFAFPRRTLLTDSAGYLELATNLRLEGRFHASEHEESLRTPGYPAFLALVQILFGEHTGFVVGAQVLLTLITAWLVHRAAQRVGGATTGVAAAWLYALSPNALFWAGTVMTETLFAFWLVLALVLLIEGMQCQSWRWCATSGLALGFAVLTRPIGLYLIPLWALATLMAARRRAGLKRAAGLAGVLLLVALAPVVAWQTRNLVAHGSFRLTASFQTVFIDYTAASTLADVRGIPRDQAAVELRQSADAFSAAMDVVRRYPINFLRVAVRGIARTFIGTEAGTWLLVIGGGPYSPSGLLEALAEGDLRALGAAIRLRFAGSSERLGTALLLWGVLYSAAVYPLSLVGLVRLRSRGAPWSLWAVSLVVVSAAYLILFPLTIGDARFRVPVEPYLAVLGGLAWTHRWRAQDDKMEVTS